MSTKRNLLLTGLKKATIEMVLLKLLSESDMYGYQITQEVKKRSSGLYTILEGSMYPILYRLHEQHYISDYEKRGGRRQIRVYYHLEDSGREHLNKMLDEYHEFLDIISFLLSSESGDVYQSENKIK